MCLKMSHRQTGILFARFHTLFNIFLKNTEEYPHAHNVFHCKIFSLIEKAKTNVRYPYSTTSSPEHPEEKYKFLHWFPSGSLKNAK